MSDTHVIIADFGEIVTTGMRDDFLRNLLESIGYGKNILVIGSGSGHLAHFLTLNNNKVLGIDDSHQHIHAATEFGKRNGVRRCEFRLADPGSLQTVDGVFDIVIHLRPSLRTANGRADLDRAVAKLAKGGRLLLSAESTYGGQVSRLLAQFRMPAPRKGFSKPVLAARDWVAENSTTRPTERLTLGELLAWINESGLEYLNCHPGILGTDGEGNPDPFARTLPGNAWLRAITQASWMFMPASACSRILISGTHREMDAATTRRLDSAPLQPESTPPRVAKLFAGIGYGLANIGFATLFFIVLNIAAYHYQAEYRRSHPEKWTAKCDFCGQTISPTNQQGQQLLTERFGQSQGAAHVAAFVGAPYFAPHPTLHYIVNPTRSSTYTVGMEGIRYYDGWTDQKVKQILSGEQPMGLIFGGSTVFGHGLSNNQTLPYFLNEISSKSGLVMLNAGAQAYDQTRELDKLIYLLRSGYRPKLVIFLDGLNDITDLAYSNYRIQDKMIFHGFSAGRGDLRLGLKATQVLTGGDYIYMFLNSLPLYRLYLDVRKPSFDASKVSPEKDAFSSPLDMDVAERLFYGWEAFGSSNQALMERQILDLYTRNMDTLERLSNAYGFRYKVFYQPIGPLDLNNPFLRDGMKNTNGYRYFTRMDKVIREAIGSGLLSMVDLSDTLRPLAKQGQAYIDYSHYSPQANQVLARAMARHLPGGLSRSELNVNPTLLSGNNQ